MYFHVHQTEFHSQKTAWGVFDKEGVKDEIGTINLLTPDVLVKAASEIRTGKRLSLNWGLEKIHEPGFERSKLRHKIINWREKNGFDFYSYDDEITVNTQAGNVFMGRFDFDVDLRHRKSVGWFE